MTNPHPHDLARLLAQLHSSLAPRAAGVWRVSSDRLEQLAFEPAADLPTEVAVGFREATRSVDLARVEFGIVRAAASGRTFLSIAEELPGDLGSGGWLRAFGAARSVAVPILGPGGALALVVSIALGLEPSAEVVEATIRRLVSSAQDRA